LWGVILVDSEPFYRQNGTQDNTNEHNQTPVDYWSFQHNDIQHNNEKRYIQHNDTWRLKYNQAHHTECHYAECR
jgi:hypothetical protein